jgi:hypothetical protein
MDARTKTVFGLFIPLLSTFLRIIVMWLDYDPHHFTPPR